MILQQIYAKISVKDKQSDKKCKSDFMITFTTFYNTFTLRKNDFEGQLNFHY